jgi:AraC-like DNA-binding protein
VQTSQLEPLNLHQLHLEKGQEWTHQRPGLHFLLANEGSGTYVSHKSALSLDQGGVLAAKATGTIRVVAAKANAFIFCIFSVCLEHLLPLLTASEISLLEPLSERLKNPKLIPAATLLATECHNLIAALPLQPGLEHRAHLLRIAARVLHEDFQGLKEVREGADLTDKHLLGAFDKLSSRELIELSVNDLALRFGCSRRHLNRLFRQYFDFSVANLKMEMRLVKAITLLRDPDAKIINVAAACGFNHLGLFNTCFRKRFGASPTEWRKNPGKNPESMERPVLSKLLAGLKSDTPIARAAAPALPEQTPNPELIHLVPILKETPAKSLTFQVRTEL